jgi:small subunit ribosomal protein S2
VTHPIPGNDDAVKSIRIIVDTLVEAVQKGLGQRDTRRAAHGAADVKAAAAAMVPAPVAAVAPAVAPAGEVDLEKIELPAHLKDITVVGEEVVVVEAGAGKIAAKKKPIRAVKKADGEE